MNIQESPGKFGTSVPLPTRFASAPQVDMPLVALEKMTQKPEVLRDGAAKDGRVKFILPSGPEVPPSGRFRGTLKRWNGPTRKPVLQNRDVGIAPLDRTPTSNFWSRRTTKEKLAFVAGGVTLVVGAIVGAAVGVTVHNRPTQSRYGSDGSFQEEFNNALNPSRWTPANNTATGGAYRCGYTTDAVNIADGLAQLSILPGNYSNRQYGCAQILHTDFFLYGKFSAKFQAAGIPGVVTALFTYTETDANKNQEIDIEITGANKSRLWATAYADGIEKTTPLPLDFDATQEIHEYAFDWRRDHIAWSVDGKEIYRLTDNLPAPVPTRLYFSTWLRAPNTFAGEYDPARPPFTAQSNFAQIAYQP